MSQIFISYARSTETKAHLIAESLRSLGYEVWRDDELPPHREYASVIEERLRDAKAVIVVWSSDGAKSQWVRAEADFARERGTLIQLTVDGVLPPMPFNQIHCVDLTGWSGNADAPSWRRIAATVAELLGQQPQEHMAFAPSLPDKPSLAVLPLVNFGDAPDQEYFVEGMTDEIVTALTRVRSLFVISNSATLSLKGQSLDLQSAARRLGVRYILEGSVRRANSRIRIAVKLTDTSAGAQIWAERFEDTLEDVFGLQDRVALSVAGVIEPNIQAAELRRATRGPVENLGCYDLYLRAAHLRKALRKSEALQALELLERALALDPEFAPALAQAAGCHSLMYFNGWGEDREAHRKQGLIMAERAISAASDDASVLTQVANALMEFDDSLGHNIDRAIGLIDRATALNPGSAFTWFISGILKIIDGNGDLAVEHLQRAARLDPISRLNEIAAVHIGIGRAFQGKHEEALRVLRASSYRTPRIHLVLLYVHGQLGQWRQSREELGLYERLTTVPAEVMLSRSMRHPEQLASMMHAIARARETSGAD